MCRIASSEFQIAGSGRQLKVVTVAGERPGPTLAVIGAIHGDELEGPLAISQLLSNLSTEEISGQLILLPVANPGAVAAARRCTPSDDKNLARCFPGDANGSETDMLADLIGQEVILKADALIDLHSAAVASMSPMLTGFIDTPGEVGARARGMAEAFGAPVVWRHAAPSPPGRTLSLAEANGIPAIYTEATGGVTPSDEIVDSYAEGVLRVMQHLGMIEAEFRPLPAPLRVFGDGNTDSPTAVASVSGLLECHAALGQPVEADDLCFTIRGVDGKIVEEVQAGQAGYPMFLRRSRWVEAGDLLISIAEVDQAVPA